MTALLATLLVWAAAGQTTGADAPPAPQATPSPAGLDERIEAYELFRGHFDAGRYQEALPFAERVVTLTEPRADRDVELPTAWNNLAATHFLLGRYDAAEVNYLKSLELLEATQGISSRRLIVPLAGLGAAHASRDQRAIGAGYYARALAVSRRAEGLFNLAQLPFVEQAADNLQALRDFAGAERERRYTLRIVEQNFGYGDPRTLPALQQLADFYERMGEYVAARTMYLRIRDVTMQESGGYNPESIRALLGIARTHRLQFMVDPEVVEGQQAARDSITGEVLSRGQQEGRVPAPSVDRTGFHSVRTALELLRATPDPPKQLLLDTLVELGDWYQATGRSSLALPSYEEAAAIHAAASDEGLSSPLMLPQMIAYRPPFAAMRGINAAPGKYRMRRTVFEFQVTESGETRDIAVAESDMSEGQLMQSRRALTRAIYRPRFENGKAVASTGVRFTSEWNELVQPEQPAESPAEATGKG
ncbi:MAG: tetratricopeptide repeat protein [Gammaproteobacteria bacterium]